MIFRRHRYIYKSIYISKTNIPNMSNITQKNVIYQENSNQLSENIKTWSIKILKTFIFWMIHKLNIFYWYYLVNDFYDLNRSHCYMNKKRRTNNLPGGEQLNLSTFKLTRYLRVLWDFYYFVPENFDEKAKQRKMSAQGTASLGEPAPSFTVKFWIQYHSF